MGSSLAAALMSLEGWVSQGSMAVPGEAWDEAELRVRLGAGLGTAPWVGRGCGGEQLLFSFPLLGKLGQANQRHRLLASVSMIRASKPSSLPWDSV